MVDRILEVAAAAWATEPSDETRRSALEHELQGIVGQRVRMSETIALLTQGVGTQYGLLARCSLRVMLVRLGRLKTLEEQLLQRLAVEYLKDGPGLQATLQRIYGATGRRST